MKRYIQLMGLTILITLIAIGCTPAPEPTDVPAPTFPSATDVPEPTDPPPTPTEPPPEPTEPLPPTDTPFSPTEHGYFSA